jgi:hypothetical protein
MKKNSPNATNPDSTASFNAVAREATVMARV